MEIGINGLHLLLLAALAEAVWETLKLVWEKHKINIDRLGSIFITIVIACGTGIDFFKILDMPLSIPYVGSILTGIIASRGANFLHDFLGIIEGMKVRNKS